jgi:hypothetical protein
MRRIVLIVIACLAVMPHAYARRRAVGVGPQYPPCSMVTGTAAVTFSHDSGATLAPSAEAKTPVAYTYGLASMLDEADTLVAWHRDDLLVSTNAGCSWRVVATIEGSSFPPKLEAAQGSRVYAWAENRSWMVRYDARGAETLRPPGEIIGLAADPANGERVRAGDNQGRIWESVDGGVSWTRIGAIDGLPYTFYRFAFSPADLDHIVAGTLAKGASVSRDGGKNWTPATGLEPGTNVFNVVFSPAAPTRVWAMGLEPGADAWRKHIYLSDDGGLTYRAVVHNSETLTLVNGPVMAADPRNADILYFIFGTALNDYGTDIFRYDASRDRVTVAHHGEVDDVNAIAFSRGDPGVIYLGLAMERAGGSFAAVTALHSSRFVTVRSAR